MTQKQPTVALIYDFDGTLSPGNMQEYAFIPTVKASSKEFWDDCEELAITQDADPILSYMAKMIQYARSKGVSLKRSAFHESGRHIRLFEGVKEWFGRINAYGHAKDVAVEVVMPEEYMGDVIGDMNKRRGRILGMTPKAGGIQEIIEGTPIAHEFNKIYACSFLYDVDGVAYWPGVAINYTNKTQFIFKINKGVESVYDSKAVNRFIPEEERPVPFTHMIYFGDGTTDIPCMRLVKSMGGHSIAVYDPTNPNAKDARSELIRENRVNFICPADYSDGTYLDTVVKAVIDKIVADDTLKSLVNPEDK